MLIQALISLISLTTTLNEVSDFAGRMEIILTVLLSTVAFKFTIAEALPNINYETKLDWYLLLNFFMIVLVVVQVVVPPLQRAAPAALGPRGPSLLLSRVGSRRPPSSCTMTVARPPRPSRRRRTQSGSTACSPSAG